MKCQFCDGKCIKKGRRNRKQVYRCSFCKKNQYHSYKHKKYSRVEKRFIAKLSNEGMSIRSISRFLSIPKTSVSRFLLEESRKIEKPKIREQGEEYEIDELRTFVGRKDKECWICYAINRKTKAIIDFVVGRKTKENIKKVIDSVLLLNPKRIYSDKLSLYKKLIPNKIHSTRYKWTNYIERNNLTLKRLNRRTICFSRSIAMLTACLRIYFWGTYSFLNKEFCGAGEYWKYILYSEN